MPPSAGTFSYKKSYNSPMTSVFASCLPEPNTGCWLWEGSYDRKSGYGWIRINGRNMRSHRAAWEETYGPIPKGLHVCHRCDTPPCVNPKHLFLGTRSDNMTDMVKKGRHVSVTMPESLVRGERHHNARLTDWQIRELMDRYRVGNVAKRALAREYGISAAAVRCILSGKVRAEAS